MLISEHHDGREGYGKLLRKKLHQNRYRNVIRCIDPRLDLIALPSRNTIGGR